MKLQIVAVFLIFIISCKEENTGDSISYNRDSSLNTLVKVVDSLVYQNSLLIKKNQNNLTYHDVYYNEFPLINYPQDGLVIEVNPGYSAPSYIISIKQASEDYSIYIKEIFSYPPIDSSSFTTYGHLYSRSSFKKTWDKISQILNEEIDICKDSDHLVIIDFEINLKLKYDGIFKVCNHLEAKRHFRLIELLKIINEYIDVSKVLIILERIIQYK